MLPLLQSLADDHDSCLCCKFERLPRNFAAAATTLAGLMGMILHTIHFGHPVYGLPWLIEEIPWKMQAAWLSFETHKEPVITSGIILLSPIFFSVFACKYYLHCSRNVVHMYITRGDIVELDPCSSESGKYYRGILKTFSSAYRTKAFPITSP